MQFRIQLIYCRSVLAQIYHSEIFLPELIVSSVLAQLAVIALIQLDAGCPQVALDIIEHPHLILVIFAFTVHNKICRDIRRNGGGLFSVNIV